MFCLCTTQWRMIAGMAGAFYQGLDYQALSAARVEMGMPVCAERMKQIHHIEAGALAVVNSR